MKCLLLFLVAAASVTAQKLEVEYDKFRDKTFLSTEARGLGAVNFRLFAQYPGDKLTRTPGFIAISFGSRTREWKFLSSNTLTFLIDGDRIKIGKAQHDGKINAGGSVTERLYYEITVDEANRIASAKSVEFQIGTFEGKFSDKDQSVFRALVEAVRVPAT